MWQDRAACIGADSRIFFPVRGAPATAAIKICSTCPVCDDCLEYAMTHVQRLGVWGGQSEKQRRRLRKQRAA